MNTLLLRIWSTLFLIPAIPVVAFYLLFNQQNYFELKEPARGIVATGPIAAYVALVLIGWTIYKRVSNITGEISPLQSKIMGSWRYVATSAHGTRRDGTAEVSDDHGLICVSGNFQDGGRDAGRWNSEMARIERQQLQILYQLEDFRAAGPTISTAVLSVHIDPQNPGRMSGNWVVLGRDDAYGDIVFERTTL
jgi:hypothetical protein